jgi:hypothetical protein
MLQRSGSKCVIRDFVVAASAVECVVMFVLTMQDVTSETAGNASGRRAGTSCRRICRLTSVRSSDVALSCTISDADRHTNLYWSFLQ